MQERDYWRLLNLNTLICHSIIVLVLILAYIGEAIKGNRSVLYVVMFSVVCLVPVVHEYVVFKRNNGSKTLKTWFVIGYAVFYTFNLLTAESVMNWVYILPMVSVLLCYCDLNLIKGLFVYALGLNIVSIILQHYHILRHTYMTTPAEILTSWEIQTACILLTGIFLYTSTKLIKDRTNIISDLIDDAYEDELTKCKNLRFFNDSQDTKFKYSDCERLCVGFLDIDDFKHFNTEYGHKFGDAVLKTLGDILLTMTADIHNTFAIRVGGDEFIIISKSLNDHTFENLCKNICKKISATNVEYNGDTSSINVSIGISTKSFDKGCRTLNEIYVKADSRNQYAKNIGKNCVVFK